MDKITVTAFRTVPPFAHGLVRDVRVRWALEEVGLPYEADAVEDRNSAAYRQKQPFGMVPAFEADGLELFESGAILHLIAEESEALMPADRPGRATTLAWMFAALNTVEPPIWNLFLMDTQYAGEPWVELRRPAAVGDVKVRLGALAARLEGHDYLTGRFTAADILMATALRFLRHTNLLAEFPVLDAYVKRCEARPAFQKALRDQLADYASHEVAA
jgi:glutathione S-transferase